MKKLFVPDHLICPIGGEIMQDPVTLESGRTYEKDNILTYFKFQRETAKRLIELADSEDEEAMAKTEADYLLCPVNLSMVDPDVMIPNQQIAAAVGLFLDEHPWAFEFNPRDKLENIMVWED